MHIPFAPSILLAAAGLAIVLGLYFRLRANPIACLVVYVVVLVIGNISYFERPQSTEVSSQNAPLIEDGLAQSESAIVMAFGLLMVISLAEMSIAKEECLSRYGLLFAAVAGMMFAVRSNDFIALGLSMEIVHRALDGLSPYVIAAPSEMTSGSSSAGVQSESSWLPVIQMGLYWLGVGMLTFCTATTNFDGVRQVLEAAYDPAGDQVAIGTPSKFLLLAIGLILVSLLARLRLLPFHLPFSQSPYQTDFTFEGISRCSLFLLASGPLIRLVGITFVGVTPAVTTLLMTVCLVNFFIASVLAMRCLSPGVPAIPCWLISVECSQGAWFIIGLMVASNELRHPALRWASFEGQSETNAICVLVQLSVLCGFGCLYWTLGYLRRFDRAMIYAEDLRGLLRYETFATISLVVAAASVIGIPLTVGFWGRWLTMLAGYNVHAKTSLSIFVPHDGLRVTIFGGVICTALVAIFSVRMVRETVFEMPLGRPTATGGRAPLIAGLCAAGSILLLGVIPQIVLVPLRMITAARSAQLEEPQRGSGHMPMGMRSGRPRNEVNRDADSFDDQ